MGRKVGLLRAVNVGGRKLVMAELRELATQIGWREVRTFIQSGNLVFDADHEPERLEAELEAAISDRFGMTVPVLVRTPAQWDRIVEANPFPEAARDEPNRLLTMFSKQDPAPDAAERLAERAVAGERLQAAGGVLWIHYPAGVGTSKLTPAAIDRACGSPTTGRNHNSLVKLREMLRS